MRDELALVILFVRFIGKTFGSILLGMTIGVLLILSFFTAVRLFFLLLECVRGGS